MKITSRILSLIVLAGLVMFYAGCHKDKNSDPVQKIQLSKLSSTTWKIKSAKLEGDVKEDRTSDFANLVLTISGTYSDGGIYQYSFAGTLPTASGSSPWPRSGTWKFGADPTMDITRLDDDPDLALNYTLSDTELTIDFTLPDGGGFAGGRLAKVSGKWQFVFVKN